MSACIPTYMLASSLIGGGMNWWQAVLTIFLGNVIVVIPMVLNAHAGTRYGIPFPVFCRASFGTLGANVPALLRAFVACGWFGIQTWIGGAAIYKILGGLLPALAAPGAATLLGITLAAVRLLPLFLGRSTCGSSTKGIDSIRWLLEHQSAAADRARACCCSAWAYQNAGGFGPILSQPSAFDPGQPKAGQFWAFFVPALTGMIGFWATLSLNIPDFSRYARSQRDQIVGQALGLPPTMALYSFIGVAVTSATTIIYGETIWDPVDVLTHFKIPSCSSSRCSRSASPRSRRTSRPTSLARRTISRISRRRRISFRIGGLITGVIGILMMPWKLVADPSGYIFTWLIGYSALLGPIGGIMIADYFVIRRTELNAPDLIARPGSIPTTRLELDRAARAGGRGLPEPARVSRHRRRGQSGDGGPFLMAVYNYAWFVGFAVALVVYWLGMRLRRV